MAKAARRSSRRDGRQRLHRCGACGSTGHRIETCTSVAAEKIRKLMAMLRKRKSKSSARGPTRRKPRRVVNKSKADYARDRRREYTIHPVPPRRKRARRQSAWGPDGRRHDVVPVLNSRESLSKLIAAGYVNGKPDKCSKCGLQGSLTDPMGRSDEADGHLYYNCWTSYDRCNGRTNCMAIGNLPFVKMTPGQVHRAVDAYTNSDNQRPPSSDDIAGLCGGGRTQTAKLVTYLRNLEAQDGQRECVRMNASEGTSRSMSTQSAPSMSL